MLRHVWLAIAIGCGTVLIISCIPIREHEVPRIEGIVQFDGDPLQGTPVAYSLFFHSLSKENLPDDCAEPLATTISQAGGRFQLDEVKKWGFMPPFPADATPTLRLCFESKRGEIVKWDYSWTGPPSTPSYIRLECDLITECVCQVLEASDEYWAPKTP